MEIRFRMRDLPIIGGEKKDELKELVIDISETSPIVFRRNDRSRNKVSEDTVNTICSSLNHFSLWVEKNRSDEILYLKYLLSLLDVKLNRNYIAEIVSKAMEEHTNQSYQELELEYFLAVIKNIIVDNDRLLVLVSEYITAITIYNFEPSSLKEGEKISNEDIHVHHILAFYTKFIYVFYYRINGIGSYIESCKPAILEIAHKANEWAKENVFLDSQVYMSISYLDRLYTFIEYSAKVEFSKHRNNIDKFSCVGMSPTYVVNRLLEEMISSLYRYKIINKEAVENKGFTLGDNIDEYGLVARNTAAYLVGTKTKVIQYIAGDFKPKYIITSHSVSATDGEDKTSEAARFEVFLDKQNKEMAIEFREQRDFIIEKMYKKLKLFGDIEGMHHFKDEKPHTFIDMLLNNGFEKTPLNMFIVSTYLESVYGVDISPILSLRQFLICVAYIHERMVKYPSLRYALFGKANKRINKVQILETDIPAYLHNSVNLNKLLDYIHDLCSYEYILDLSVGTTNAYTIKDELVLYMNNIGDEVDELLTKNYPCIA